MTAKEKLPGTVWVLLGAAFCIAIGFGLIAPVLPRFATGMAEAIFPEAAVTATTVVISAFAVFRLLWATPAGAMASRFGEKNTYVAGVFIVALSTLLVGFSTSYWQLLLFRALGGIGSVMFSVSAMGLLIRIAPRSMRGRVSALYGATFLFGNMVGPVLGGLLGQFGLRMPFYIYAGSLSLAGILMAVFMPSALGKANRESTLPVFSLGEALQDRAFRANIPAMFAHGWTNFGVRIAIVPLFIGAVYSRAPWASGTALAVYAIGNAIVLPFSSHFADVVGRRPMIIWGLSIAGVVTIAMGYTMNPWLIFTTCFIGGLGTGMFMPASQAVIADVVGSDRTAGKVVAVTQMVADIGTIVGPIATGLIVDHGGYGVALTVTGMLCVISVVPWLNTPDTLARAQGS